MKKMIVKITGIMALTMLIALNVTSTMKFSPGGQEVEARMTEDEIPCYSSYRYSDKDAFVYCLTCGNQEGKRNGWGGECTIIRE